MRTLSSAFCVVVLVPAALLGQATDVVSLKNSSAPQSGQPTTVLGVPRLVRVSSSFHTANGSAPAAVESATLAIYAEEAGGTALWQETQNVSVDSDGRYSVLLGSTRNEGLPLELFASGEPRWLGVQFQRPGEAEQPRILLASVPYALKAADADTLGGLPASAYVVAEPATGSSEGAAAKTGVASTKIPLPRTSSGTPNYIGKFVNSTDLVNSVMFESGGMIGLGTTPHDFMHVAFTNTDGALTGYAVQNLGNNANSYSGTLFYDQNGMLGQFQGFNNVTHEYRINNIASGGSINFMLNTSKFQVRSDGDIDIAGNVRKGGTFFLHTNGSGGFNTAVGVSASGSITAGGENTAVGNSALGGLMTGNGNTAVGRLALGAITTTNANVAVGDWALRSSIGGGNVAIGYLTAANKVVGDQNIYIGQQVAMAASLESNTIRLGDAGFNNRAFIGGIRNVVTGNADTVPVVIDSAGQLGTMNSSRRFKEDIHDMGGASSALLQLRPVTYRYKQPYADGSKPLDYGLIAEEVAEVYPDLVVKNKDGRVETVQYQKLTPMLLNEVQKQHIETAKLRDELQKEQECIVRQEQQNHQQQGEIETLKAKLAGMSALEARLAALEALLSSKVPTTANAGQ